MVFKQPNLIYSVTLQNELNDKCSQDYLSAEWNFMEMLNFRRSKKTIVSYDTHSPFFNQMLNLWSICYRIIPQEDWLQQSWSLVPNYNGSPGEKMRLRLLNNKIHLQVWKSSKINFMEKDIMFMYKGNLYLTTSF